MSASSGAHNPSVTGSNPARLASSDLELLSSHDPYLLGGGSKWVSSAYLRLDRLEWMFEGWKAGLVDGDWLDVWRASLASAVERVVSGFEDTYGFPPDDHTIGPPGSAQELDALSALPVPVPGDLIDFYARIGAVTLPDVGNGYFIHSPALVARHARAGELQRIGPPIDTEVLVFGSDGGGAQYALPLAGAGAGPVYRLSEVAVEAGVADAETGAVQVVADDFAQFLGLLLFATETFAASGDLIDL
jgi:hypothetical protein